MERNIRAFIVDDDKGARQILNKYLEITGKVDVIGEASDTATAFLVTKRELPDVIFLDINMPDENGLQFAERLQKAGLNSLLVFTTAYKDYAYPAFKFKPVDYLVKPFGIDEIFEVLFKVEKIIIDNANRLIKSNVWGSSIPDKLRYKVPGGYSFICPSEIVYIKSFSNFVELNLKDGKKEKVISSLSDLYHDLKNRDFFRVNRSAIVNMNYVLRIDKKARKCIVQINENEIEFPFAISIFKQFEEMNSIKLG